jgi:hypothetical protein
MPKFRDGPVYAIPSGGAVKLLYIRRYQPAVVLFLHPLLASIYSLLFDPTARMRYTLFASLLSAVTSVYGYANPMACSGICNNAHDPALIRRADGTYFRFSTGGKIAIHTAPAITGPWTYKGAAIPNGSKINLQGKDDLWVSIATLPSYQL